MPRSLWLPGENARATGAWAWTRSYACVYVSRYVMYCHHTLHSKSPWCSLTHPLISCPHSHDSAPAFSFLPSLCHPSFLRAYTQREDKLGGQMNVVLEERTTQPDTCSESVLNLQEKTTALLFHSMIYDKRIRLLLIYCVYTVIKHAKPLVYLP